MQVGMSLQTGDRNLHHGAVQLEPLFTPLRFEFSQSPF